MPGIIRQFRWSRLLAKAFDLKGASPELQVLDDVMPVVQLYDPTDVEHHFGRDEILWSRSFNQAAVAGQYGRVEVGTREGYITVIEGLVIHGIAAGRTYNVAALGTTTMSGTATSGVRVLDQRFETLVSPGAQLWVGTTAAASTGEAATYMTAANTSNQFPVGVVLDADDIWAVQAVTPNEIFQGTIYGYDRRAEMSERG